jgi:hypothetical protein
MNYRPSNPQCHEGPPPSSIGVTGASYPPSSARLDREIQPVTEEDRPVQERRN